MENSDAAFAQRVEKVIQRTVGWEKLELEMAKLQETTIATASAKNEEINNLKEQIAKLTTKLQEEEGKWVSKDELNQKEKAMNQEIADAMELAKTKEGDQYDPYPLSYDTSLEEFFERTLEKDEKRFARGDMDKVQEKVNMENLKKVQEK